MPLSEKPWESIDLQSISRISPGGILHITIIECAEYLIADVVHSL
jgi:hypothetical protein